MLTGVKSILYPGPAHLNSLLLHSCLTVHGTEVPVYAYEARLRGLIRRESVRAGALWCAWQRTYLTGSNPAGGPVQEPYPQ